MNDPLEPRPGFLSSEFWTTLGASLAALVVALGFMWHMKPEDSDSVAKTITVAVTAIGTIVGLFVAQKQYVAGRTAVKVECVRQSTPQLENRMAMYRYRMAEPPVIQREPVKTPSRFNTGVPVYPSPEGELPGTSR